MAAPLLAQRVVSVSELGEDPSECGDSTLASFDVFKGAEAGAHGGPEAFGPELPESTRRCMWLTTGSGPERTEL
ncbi:hypothetical protein NDU88_000642 [Pleurodeles waltl]|uniref:Uncharacterized protein n=1 Tax=Pleurodeles waltl TaxID=8319 RepID=A0AAV7LYP2_PLEWA|nr:hypothetical protein NDU88_000642 [Pleurodeles waltl]